MGDGAVGWEGRVVGVDFETELLAFDPPTWFKDAGSVSLPPRRFGW